MTDLAERTAKRAGDMQAVWVARFRRGACPGCGVESRLVYGMEHRLACCCCADCYKRASETRETCPACTLLREEVA